MDRISNAVSGGHHQEVLTAQFSLCSHKKASCQVGVVGVVPFRTIVGFALAVVNDFRGFLSQFSTNFHEISHTLFSIHVVTNLKVLINILV